MDRQNKINNLNVSVLAKQCFQLLTLIPKGRVTTYSQIAKALGRPKAARAIGRIIGSNPLAPEIPCHRVVRNDGRLGGYSGGIQLKLKLLKSEGVTSLDGQVVDFTTKFIEMVAKR